MSEIDVAAALGEPRKEGRGWRCRCPLRHVCLAMPAAPDTDFNDLLCAETTAITPEVSHVA